MDFEEESLTSSSSSSSSNFTATNPNYPSPISHKRKAGRKKFQETRHPIYRCVRRRNGSKWVCEVREPNKKSRIWLGTFPNPEMAARAHDVAALALRGEMAALNFPDSAWLLPRAKSSSARDIQSAALEAARAFQPPMSPSSSSSSDKSLRKGIIMRPPSINVPDVKSRGKVPEPSSSIDSKTAGNVLEPSTMFLDEEALFNFPGLLDSMAEGLLLTPLAMKNGFNWGDAACDMELKLWGD